MDNKALTEAEVKRANLRALHEHYFGKPINLPQREPDIPEPSPYTPAGIRARYLRNANKG
jgi:hypothetical protein